jgi:hypothetical protein
MFEAKIFDQELLPLEEQVLALENCVADSRVDLLTRRLQLRLKRDYARSALSTMEYVSLSRRVLKVTQTH